MCLAPDLSYVLVNDENTTSLCSFLCCQLPPFFLPFTLVEKRGETRFFAHFSQYISLIDSAVGFSTGTWDVTEKSDLRISYVFHFLSFLMIIKVGYISIKFITFFN
jgi:hypothetical protein